MNRKLLFVIFSLFLPSLMFAQTFRHPYSYYGIGELQDYNLINSQSLGSLGTAWNDRFSFSSTNPASYSNLEFTTFDLGIKGKLQLLQQDKINEWTNYFSFAYAAFGFPVSRKHNWGVSFGVLPVSRIGYKNFFSFNVDTTTTLESFDKQGGFNKLYLGSSISLFDHFNIGFNVSYIFGNTTFNHSLEFIDDSRFLAVNKSIFNSYSGMGVDLGIQYKNKLKNGLPYTLGASFSLPVSLNSYEENTTYTYRNTSSYIYLKDTIDLLQSDKSSLYIPWSLSIGGIFNKKNKWKAGFDFKYENWSDFVPENSKFKLSDQWSFALGGEIIPKYDELAYLKRVSYRGGIRYTNSFLKIDGEQYTKMSAVLGLGLPFYRKAPGTDLVIVSYINFAAEVGTMGKSSPTLIKETFFNFFLGFQLNDIWFIKPKYN
jgi:hypothetical protein